MLASSEKQNTGAIVVARPHPLSSDLVTCDMPEGLTIREILGPNAQSCVVEIGGVVVPEQWWEHMRPRRGVTIHVTRCLQGGSTGKMIFRIVAFAALAVVTYGIASGVAWMPEAIQGLSQGAAMATAAAVGIGGALVINALCPPASVGVSSSTSVTTLKSITGVENQADPYGAVVNVLGTQVLYPKQAANPYTELSGDDQYLRMLFDFGHGSNLTYAAMQIGTNDLANYTDVEYEVGTSPTLFSQDISEATAGDELDTDGNAATRTTGALADECAIDLVFASGLFAVNSKGSSITATCKILIEYQAVSGGSRYNAMAANGLTISNASAAKSGSYLSVSSSAQKSLRIGLRWKLPTKDEYNVYVTRISTDYQGAAVGSREGNLTWTTIRTIRYTSASTTPTTKFALRIKASDQLNGTINQFNLLVSQQIPVWNGSTWVIEESSNPAWIYRYVLKDDPANSRHVDPSLIDDDIVKQWGAECDANGFTFDYTVDSATTVFDLLKIICACGRASFTTRDGKYSVVRDLPQTLPVQIFTPRNSSSFGGSRAFVDTVHALRVQFINPEASYQQDEVIVYDDYYDNKNAINFETLEIPGCASAEMAWKLGRYHLAVARLRPNVYSWTADIENLRCNRGDLVYYADDVLQVGQAWGRIKAITLDGNGNATAISVDEPFDASNTSGCGVRIRRQDGTVSVVGATAGNVADLTMCNALNLSTPVSGVNVGDLFLYGHIGQDVLPLVISKIEAAQDLSAKITAVDQAPAVLTADQGYIDSSGTYHSGVPTITSKITGQAWLDVPDAPQQVICNSMQTICTLDDSGGTQAQILVTVG